jgi:hypothetical protein
VFQFTTSALILSPLTFLWLEGLESRFPGIDEKVEPEKEKTKEKPTLNVRNTVAKILVDQVIGGAWNTVAFIATMGVLRGQDYEVIKGQIVNVCKPAPHHTGPQASWLMLYAGATVANCNLTLSDCISPGLLADAAGGPEIMAVCLDSELYGCASR